MTITSRRAGPSTRTAGRNGWRRSITNESDDRRLVGAFLSRSDEDSFRALYRAHTAAVYRVALRILGGRDGDAEEAVQSTWIVAAERLPGFRWESGLRTWLVGIAVNVCRDILRRRARERSLSGSDAAEESGPAAPAQAATIDLERAVARLPDGYREVLVLHEIEGYTHEEIAGLLGIDSGTSKSQLSRARRALRDELRGDPGTEKRNEGRS